MDFLYLPLSFLIMEILAKLHIFGKLIDENFGFLFPLTLAMGCLASGTAFLFNGKGRRIFHIVVLAAAAILFSFHMSYQNNFHSYFSWHTLGQAKDVTEFWKEASVAAFGVWYLILAFFLPLIGVCVFGKKLTRDAQKRSLFCAAVCLVFGAGCYTGTLWHLKEYGIEDTASPYYGYVYMQKDLEQAYRNYGILNTTRLDIKQLIFGAPIEKVDFIDINDLARVSGSDQKAVSDVEEQPKEYGWHKMDFDFAKAADTTNNYYLKNMDEYFSQITPTKKNRYTGYFKDKNLIFITAEAFCSKVIDPELTPTLYKMATEGFVFQNFYNSTWGGSTASGEYSNITGNFYTTANCLEMSGNTYQPFALGNQFSRLGYKTVAYHNHTYTYYGRDKSHPNFGYDYQGIGNGLEMKACWPRSDKELAEITVDNYKNAPKFHAYYMSVSGHANYSFTANRMSYMHYQDVPEKYAHYPEDVQAYIACQYELELMLETLVRELEQCGVLENTVFALAADHYPYALTTTGLSKLYGLPENGIRNNLDLYRNSFILWSASMEEPIVIDTPCSTIDILPTLSNLFDLEYDSRLMMGSDILCDGEHFALVKVNGWSWISTQGTYIASMKYFEPNQNCTMTQAELDEYIKAMKKIVAAKSTYSLQILELDYYRHIFDAGLTNTGS